MVLHADVAMPWLIPRPRRIKRVKLNIDGLGTIWLLRLEHSQVVRGVKTSRIGAHRKLAGRQRHGLVGADVQAIGPGAGQLIDGRRLPEGERRHVAGRVVVHLRRIEFVIDVVGVGYRVAGEEQ